MFPVLRSDPPPSSPEERNALINKWFEEVKALTPAQRKAMFKANIKPPPWLEDWYLLDDLLLDLIGWDEAEAMGAMLAEQTRQEMARKGK